MSFITLPAHFDDSKICLDKEYPLKPDTRLMVVVLSPKEQENWYNVSVQGLAGAYSPDEANYSAALIKEPNKDYLK